MNAKAELIPANQGQVVQASATTLLQVIQQAATNPQVDIDKMERLMAMHERLTAREAETAWNDALSACQTEMRPIATDANNPQTKSRYATYFALDRALRPIYTRHGFSISWDTDHSPEPDCIRVLGYLSRGSHTRTYKIDMPKDGKGAKGGDVMTKTHATGAGMSYGKRYLLGGMFNVQVGEDIDGNDPASRMPAEKLAELKAAIESATTKETAKVKMAEAAKICDAIKDTRAYEELKQAYHDHLEFMKGAK